MQQHDFSRWAVLQQGLGSWAVLQQGLAVGQCGSWAVLQQGLAVGQCLEFCNLVYSKVPATPPPHPLAASQMGRLGM